MVSVKGVSDRACFLRARCRRVFGFVQEVGYPLRPSLAYVVKVASVWCGRRVLYGALEIVVDNGFFQGGCLMRLVM